MPRMRIVGFLLALGLLAPVARAQDFEAASKHFAAAQQAYSSKDFHVAAAEFEQAFALTKDPVLLYNIGESYEHAGDGHKAVDSYRAYLKGQPTAPDAGEVKSRIARIEKRHFELADESVTHSAPRAPSDAPMPVAPLSDATPTPAPVTAASLGLTPLSAPAAEPVATKQLNDNEAPQKPREPELTFLDDGPRTKLRTVAWVGVAATVAVFTTGAILGLAAQSRADEVSRRLNFVDSTGQPAVYDAAAQSDLNSLRHDGQLYNNMAIGFFAASGALLVATVVLFVVDRKHAKERIVTAFGAHGAELGLGGSF